MGMVLKLTKGLRVNRPVLATSQLTCDNDPGNERLAYGGLNGPVIFPNNSDVQQASATNSMMPPAISLDGLTVGNILLTWNLIVLGNGYITLA